MAKRRRRGVVLTPEGLEKFQAARLKHEAEENFGERYTYEKLSELTYLDIHTIKRVIECQEGVDKRTLERIFISFNLDLDESCYTKPNPHRRQHWGDAMCVTDFYGRTEELKTLENWLLKDRCRLITMLGMGGMGKTCLSVKLAKDIQERFDLVMWCSLRDAPSATDVVTRIVEFLSDGKDTASSLPESFGEKVNKLIEYLRASRCLILLDNLESLLCGDKRAGIFREGFTDYGDFLLRLGETEHISSVIVTTREKPKEVARMEGEGLPVRTYRLYGLEEAAGEQILKQKKLQGNNADYSSLIEYYGGNALALKVVATTIKELFQGDIPEFLNQETAVFGDIRDLLAQQFNRLTPLEREVMYWLAINREPLTIDQLRDDLVSKVPKLKLLEALESLSRRSLVERDEGSFTLQNVVMEYAICRFLERVCEELINLELELFRYHAIIKATAKDYVRETQIRLILEPLLEQLEAHYKSNKNVTKQLNKTLAFLRKNHAAEASYAGGNLINMLCHLKADFTGYDFSNLAIWQADFRNSCFHNVNLAHSDLSKSMFAEAFGGIWSVAFSPDGEILATGDTKGEIILRRVSDGQLIQSFKGHTGWVVSLDFSPDGHTLASSSCDCTAKLWDIKTGQCIHTLNEHEHEVWSVAFSPSGKVLATGCDDTKVRLWQVDTGECFDIILEHTNSVLAVNFDKSGRKLLSGGDDRIIRLWNLETGKCEKVFEGHKDGVRSLTICADGQTFASSSNDCTIRLWNIQTGECLEVFRGHSNVVLSVTFCQRNNILASGSMDQTVRLWNIQTGECIKNIQGHVNWINSVAFSPREDVMVSGSYDQTVKLWNIHTYKCLKTIQGYSNQALSIVSSPDGQTLASGGQDQKVRLWNLKTGKILKTLHNHNNWVWSVAFSPQGNYLASGSGDKTIKLWNANTGRIIKTLQGHQAVVRSIAFSSNNHVLVSGSEDKTLRLWNINTGETIRIFQGHQAEIWSIDFSPDGQIIASGSMDGTVKLWDVQTGDCLKTLKEHEAWILSVAFCSNNKTLASSSPDQTIRLWNVDSGKCKQVLHEDIGYSQLIAFSRDGKLLASCNQAHNIKIWNLESGECLKVLTGHKALINSIVFCPDNYTLISSSEDETIKLWNIKSGECINNLKVENPYEGMNLLENLGLTEANIERLKELGAINAMLV